MSLFDEEILKQPQKKKTKIKSTTIIVILIVLLLLLCVISIIAIMYLKSKILIITVDADKASELKNILIMEENDKVYIPIKRMANYFGYEAYTGDYITRTEDDIMQCYIESNEELVSFKLNSNILTKKRAEEIEQIKIKEPIKEINGELCISSECTREAFNFIFFYDKSNNKIVIQTLEYIYGIAFQNAIDNGYEGLSETLKNKEAIYENLVIVKAPNGCYGVVDASSVSFVILETKYDDIQYIKSNSEFLVESNGKCGIIKTNKKTKIEPIYDGIEILNNNLYIVRNDNLYGVLDEEGKKVMHTEYEKIGMDVGAYSKNGVTNGHIFYENIIPIQKNEKWALFNFEEQKQITDFEYDSFGCWDGKDGLSRTYGVLLLQDYDLIVACKDNKYNFINKEGELVLEEFNIDSVYVTNKEGKEKYFVSIGEKDKELDIFLEEKGIGKNIKIEQ